MSDTHKYTDVKLHKSQIDRAKYQEELQEKKQIEKEEKLKAADAPKLSRHKQNKKELEEEKVKNREELDKAKDLQEKLDAENLK